METWLSIQVATPLEPWEAEKKKYTIPADIHLITLPRVETCHPSSRPLPLFPRIR